MTGQDGLFGSMFGTDEMRAIFTDAAMVQSWLDVEVALAAAESNVGVIPAEAAREIARRARVELLDLEEIRRQIDVAEHPLVPVIWALAALCEGDAGGCVHWGATTQDIMDTGMVLQVRSALDVLESHLGELLEAAAVVADRERDSLMAGRTHGQQALPITFGLKAASWLDELIRHRARLQELRGRVIVGQLAGAAGTLASLGDDGVAVREEFCRLLDLPVPGIGWHVARDGLAELAGVLGMVSATCARIAGEVILLQKSEVAEVFERHDSGNVGSSTMPQKRNPMTAESVVAASRLVRRTSATGLEGIIGQHERDMGAWQAEWAWIPEVCIVADATVVQTVDVVGGLVVDRERMRANLEVTGGLLMAERVMIELGRVVGRQLAHDRVHEIAMRAVEEERSFAALLAADPVVVDGLGGTERIAELLDTATYLGATSHFIDRTLDAYRQGVVRAGGATAEGASA